MDGVEVFWAVEMMMILQGEERSIYSLSHYLALQYDDDDAETRVMS